MAEIRQQEYMPAARNRNRALCFTYYFIFIMPSTIYYILSIIITLHSDNTGPQQHTQMTHSQDTQKMLEQIRALLTHSADGDMLRPAPHLTDQQIKQYLTESYKLVHSQQANHNHNDHSMNSNSNSKISQASQLLSQQSSMIKNYVKNKIQSECFVAKQLGNNEEHHRKLLKLRETLEKKRLEQKMEESARVTSMIESVRKFSKQEVKSSIPLPQLQSYLHKEKSDYDNVLKQQIRIKSANNKLKEKPAQFLLPNNEQNRQAPKKLGKLSVPAVEQNSEFIIEVQGDEEDQHSFLKKKSDIKDKKIVEALKKATNFMGLFCAFLEKIKKITEIQETTIPEHDIDTAQRSKKRFRFYNQFQPSSQVIQSNRSPGMNQLSRAYKFKPFLQSPQEQPKKIAIEPIRKVISKRIGDSNKYHMKQCMVIGSIFYYSQQPANQSTVKIEDMKSIEIQLNPLQMVRLTKEQGSIFQKKQTEIDCVVLKGVTRKFIYELNMTEGVQLTEQLTKVNLRRLHAINCLIGAQGNGDMGRLIEGEHSVLNLSNKYLRLEEEYPSKQFRSNFIKMLLRLFPTRKATQQLNFTRCHLSLTEINLILSHCESHFTHISKLSFSQTKLDRETLKNILSLVKKCPENELVELNLDNCGLDDDVIDANIVHLGHACSKIGVLELSGNEITAKSLRSLKNVFATKICEIRELRVTGCPLEQFPQFCAFVKNSNKIQRIVANQCKFTINNQKVLEDLLISTQQKQELKRIDLRRNICTGAITWFEQISPFLEIAVDLPIKPLAGNKMLESKYLRVSEIINK